MVFGFWRGGVRVWCDCDFNFDLRVGVLGYLFLILSVGCLVIYLCWYLCVVVLVFLVYNDVIRK